MSHFPMISVTAVRFDPKGNMVPRRFEHDGICYELTGSCKTLIIKGEDGDTMYFEVSDEHNWFRLRHEPPRLRWQLLGMTSRN